MAEPTPPTRDQLLDSAESLFARKGYDGATVKDIGQSSGVNPALLYYYFEGKDELYHAVLERIVTRLITRGSAALDRPVPPADAIRGLIAAQVEFLLEQPNLPRLMVREMVDHEARHAREIILQLAAGLFQRLCRVIEEGQRSGVFRADLEPRFAAVSIVSQAVYFVIARPAVGIFLGAGPGGVSDETVRDFARHAGEFAVRALSAGEHP